LLRELRLNADAQNEVIVLREQVVKEAEALSESIDDQGYDFDRYNISKPVVPAENDDKRGESLVITMENLSISVSEKLEDRSRVLEEISTDIGSKERVVSEKSALLTHKRQALASHRTRVDVLNGDDGAIKKYDRVLLAMRKYASEIGIVSDFDEKDPQSVLSFLDAQLDDLLDAAGDANPELAVKVVKRMKKLVRG
jgi:hypothetical protein